MSSLTFIGNWAAKSKFWPLSITKRLFIFSYEWQISHMFCESRSTACSCGPLDHLSSAFVRPFWLHLCLWGPEGIQILQYSQWSDRTDYIWPKVRIKRPHSIHRTLQHSKGVKGIIQSLRYTNCWIYHPLRYDTIQMHPTCAKNRPRMCPDISKCATS